MAHLDEEIAATRVRADRFAADAAAEIQAKIPDGETVDTAWDSLPPRLRGMVHALLKVGTFDKLIGALLVKTASGDYRPAYLPGTESGQYVESEDLLGAIRASGSQGVEFGWPLPKGK